MAAVFQVFFKNILRVEAVALDKVGNVQKQTVLYQVIQPGDVIHVNVKIVLGAVHILRNPLQKLTLAHKFKFNGNAGLSGKARGKKFCGVLVARSTMRIRSPSLSEEMLPVCAEAV